MRYNYYKAVALNIVRNNIKYLLDEINKSEQQNQTKEENKEEKTEEKKKQQNK